MGCLTTHVLDTAHGKPGAGISYELTKLGHDRTTICSGVTNDDGRTDKPLLSDDEFKPGTYELVFKVGQYFSSETESNGTTPFLDTIPIQFTLTEDEHFHVPLLVSPWSYSTYRGS